MQDVAAMGFRSGETSGYDFITNLLLSLLRKNFENWPAFGKVRGKNIVVPCFFQTLCILPKMLPCF